MFDERSARRPHGTEHVVAGQAVARPEPELEPPLVAVLVAEPGGNLDGRFELGDTVEF